MLTLEEEHKIIEKEIADLEGWVDFYNVKLEKTYLKIKILKGAIKNGV